MTNKRSLSLLAVALLATGCISERVVLLPSGEGKTGALVVREHGSEILLNRPYAASARGAGSSIDYQASEEDVKVRFADAMAALPLRAKSYTVYFASGVSETLTPESLLEFDKVKADLAQRPAGEIRVIGHADRVGSIQFNDAFSLRRAATVRELLIAAGVPATLIESAGRGEREPLVATADEVDEPLNRRVEINVR